VTTPFRLDKVNATLASGHYAVDDEGDDDLDDESDHVDDEDQEEV
jgi:hypothetical protein